MKRKTYQITIAAGALLLAGCGAGEADSSQSDGKNGSGPKLALVAAVPADPFLITIQCGAKDAVAKIPGATLDYQASKNWDATEQRTVLDSVLATKPDGLLVMPTDSTAFQRPLEDASKSGIKVAFVDTAVDDPSFGVSSIATDNVAAGAKAFEGMKEYLSGGKIAAISASPGITSTDQRLKGFQDALEDAPDFDLVSVQHDKTLSAAGAAQITSALLAKDPDIAGIFVVTNNLAEGAVTALKQLGRDGKVTVVGFDPTTETAELVKEGSVAVLVAQDPYAIGEAGVQQVVAGIDGKPTEAKIATPINLLTKDNIDTDGDKYTYKTKC